MVRKSSRHQIEKPINAMLEVIPCMSADLVDTASESSMPGTPVEEGSIESQIYRRTILQNYPATGEIYTLVQRVLDRHEAEVKEQEDHKRLLYAPYPLLPNSVQSGPPTRQITPALDMADQAV